MAEGGVVEGDAGEGLAGGAPRGEQVGSRPLLPVDPTIEIESFWRKGPVRRARRSFSVSYTSITKFGNVVRPTKAPLRHLGVYGVSEGQRSWEL